LLPRLTPDIGIVEQTTYFLKRDELVVLARQPPAPAVLARTPFGVNY
jgi:hypothetical protein